MLVNRVIAWDGWVYYGLLRSGQWHALVRNHLDAAAPEGIITYGVIRPFADLTLASKLFIFTSLLVSTWSLLWLLRRHMSDKERFCVICTTLFGLQMNVVVWTGLGMGNYAFAGAMFAIGAVLDGVAREQHKRLQRCSLLALATICFAASFTLACYLVFFAVFAASAWIRSKCPVFRFAVANWFYVLLVTLSWIVAPRPAAGYVGYNDIHPSKYWLLAYPLALVRNVVPTAILPIRYILQQPLLVFVLVAFIPVAWLFTRRLRSTAGDAFPLSGILVFSVFAYACAVFPFAAVGKVAGIADWNSRFAVLIPLPESLIVAAALFVLEQHLPRLGRMITVAVLGILAVGPLETYRRWDVDWLKQQSVIEQLRTNSIIRQSATIFVDDRAPQLNNFDRRYRFYEYDGWFFAAYGNRARLAIPIDGISEPSRALDLVTRELTSKLSNELFLVDQRHSQTPAAMLTIRLGSADLRAIPVYVRVKFAQLRKDDAEVRRILFSGIRVEARTIQ